LKNQILVATSPKPPLSKRTRPRHGAGRDGAAFGIAVNHDDEFEEVPQREPAWQARDRVAAYRKGLLAAGYSPLPVNGKAPPLDGWQKTCATDKLISYWIHQYPDALSTGILTRNTPAVDIDVTDEEMAEELTALAEEIAGKSAIRIGRAPKRAMLYRTDAPFPKLSTAFTSPTGDAHRIEVLADGQQIVINGTHPDTNRPYTWHGGEPGPHLKREQLPLLTAEKAAEFITAAAQLMTNRGWILVGKKKTNGDARPSKSSCQSSAIRERAYTQAALDGSADELGHAPVTTRNDMLYRKAFRLGTMVARGWINRGMVEDGLFAAAADCGLNADDGETQTRKTIQSGLDGGMDAPHPDLPSDAGESWQAAPKIEPNERKAVAKLNLTEAASIEQRPVNWVWRDRIARGKLTLMTGEPGVGKSQIALDIVARQSAGRPWPNEGTAPLGNSIILSAEDAANDTICPRLEIAGADLRRITVLESVTEGGKRRTFSIQKDLHRLAQAISDIGNVTNVLVDPITSYMGMIDGHRTTDVRAVLEPFDKFAEDCNVAILAVTHPPKASQGKAIHNFTGSLAFVAAARLAFVCVEEPETDRSLLLAVKNNLGPKEPGLGYRFEQRATAKGIWVSRVVWDTAPVNTTANEAIAMAAVRRGSALREAEEFLRDYLADGPMPANKVDAAAEENEITRRTLKRARKSLKIVATKSAFDGGWTWSLP
jgi:AAA domain-containing protein/bifunctional DNA primase/polymerase-like protein